MDLEKALLEAIHADPADLTPWLVLADWLEETGDARAELFRLTLERRRRPAPEQERRLQELLAQGVRPYVPALANSLGMELALVPPGSFLRGSPAREPGRGPQEGPPHEVEITRPFYLGVCPVTQGQYAQVMGHNPSYFAVEGAYSFRVKGLDTRRFPVEHVTWNDAVAFCARLSRLPAEKQAGRVYRLPTEGEWEYACRAGTTTPFAFGASLSSAQANFNGNHPYGGAEVGPFLERTRPVGSSPPNAWGLFDMHGNVWEWCADWFEEYPGEPRADPSGPAWGTRRVIRGGAYNDGAGSCRSAWRAGLQPDRIGSGLGFRVVLPAGLP
jgi:uncharacterized protein (TIGR02996 family)